jgi:hypothetical protein
MARKVARRADGDHAREGDREHEQLLEVLRRVRPHVPAALLRELVLAFVAVRDAELSEYDAIVNASVRSMDDSLGLAHRAGKFARRTLEGWQQSSRRRIEPMLSVNRDKYQANTERDDAIAAAILGGAPHHEVMRRFDVSRATLYRVLKRKSLTRSR